ncbi:thermonuclease family protein [Prosthecobacter dejongeii]|uniref:Endonuclease YncB(Thermonuclease family) n=1 Tax=Prosthecobacter dejongeii TaxID=48465 RepID=A0A7W7YPZ9_9BACT|nr:thermonuclease family protein [Prosthecobacter dejongeii]MBB5040213.1 endonuclease YncB(thermonuclease family) [Prosthecobacter dejongeii]
MRRRRRRSRPFSWLGLLILLAFGTQIWNETKKAPPSIPEARSGKAAKVFEVMYDARLIEDRNNDGDSFKMTYRGKVHEWRLYFADCAEKRRHAYNGDRLREQGQYFGGLSEARTVALGQQAQAFTQQWLEERSFTVYTKWQGVFDSGRHYAFVVFPDGEDLSAKLVREGLARIHTTGTTLPGGRSAAEYGRYLRALEAEARAAGRGGWAR